MRLQHAMFAAEMTITEATITYDALGLLLAAFETAARFPAWRHRRLFFSRFSFFVVQASASSQMVLAKALDIGFVFVNSGRGINKGSGRLKVWTKKVV